MSSYTLEEAEFKGTPLLEVHYPYDFSQLELQPEPYDRIVVHHPGSRDYSIEDLIELHVKKQGWGAIGYHVCIGGAGELFYTRSLAFKGAHAFPNTGKIGVSFLRSFTRTQPNEQEIRALGQLAELVGKESPLPLLGHNQDQLYELVKTQGLNGEHQELLRRLAVPSSERDFETARQKLYKVKDTVEFQERVACLKTCPGLGFYQALASAEEDYQSNFPDQEQEVSA